MTQTYSNWRLETDEDQIYGCILTNNNAAVNTIDRAVMEEFTQYY